MGFLKRLFGARAPEPEDTGIYVFVRLQRRAEVVRIRINPQADITHDYDSGERTVRKTIVGPDTFERAQAVLSFDSANRLIHSEVAGGDLVDEAAYAAYQAGRQGS